MGMAIGLQIDAYVTQGYNALVVTFHDSLNLSMMLLYSILAAIFALTLTYVVCSKFEHLQDRDVRNSWKVLYKDYRTSSKCRALYNLWFLGRRTITVVALLKLSEYTIFQGQLISWMSFMNLFYLMASRPMLTKRQNQIEWVNEAATYICALCLFVETNVAFANEAKDILAWTFVAVLSLTIVLNLSIVCYSFFFSVLHKVNQIIQNKKALKARNKILENRYQIAKCLPNHFWDLCDQQKVFVAIDIIEDLKPRLIWASKVGVLHQT